MIYSDLERGINFAAVRAAVESGLVWLQSDPARGIRNLLDLGGYFARTSRQREFYQTARRLLSSRRSQYMRLIERALTSVDIEVLKTIGINLGYFSWSFGTRMIREIEASLGIFVPWSIVFRLDGACPNALGLHEVKKALEQAHSLGVHSFWFSVHSSNDYLAALIRLFGTFRDCAFMLLMDGTRLTRELAQLARIQHNTLICIDMTASADDRATAMLREAGLIFGLSLTYDDSNADFALNGTLLGNVERIGGHFALLLRAARCSEHCQSVVHKYVVGERSMPARPAFIVDVFADIAQIDRNISAHDCYVEVSPDGFVSNEPWGQRSKFNLRCAPLCDILRALARKPAAM